MKEIITAINTKTASTEKIIIQHRNALGYAILGVGFLLAIPPFFMGDSRAFVGIGGTAWNIFLIIAFLGPVARLSGLRLLAVLLPLRKELGMVMGMLAAVHGLGILAAGGIISLQEPAVYSGVVPLVLVILLALTSNTFSQKLLARHWKTLHLLTIPAFVLTAVHIAVAKPNDAVEIIVIAILYVGLRIVEKFKKSRLA